MPETVHELYWRHNIQQNDSQYNNGHQHDDAQNSVTQYNGTQHNEMKYGAWANDTQHNDLKQWQTA